MLKDTLFNGILGVKFHVSSVFLEIKVSAVV